MNIGQASRHTGVSARMIRYYERIGLMPPAARRDSNYRDYSDDDIARLQFIRRGRDLGFSLQDIGVLLSQWHDADRDDAKVRAVADGHIERLRHQMTQIQDMIARLERIGEQCRRRDGAYCVIIDALAQENFPPSRPKSA